MKKMKSKPKNEDTPRQLFYERWGKWEVGLILTVILLCSLVIFYKPYVIDRLEPAGGDRLASIAQSKQINDWQKETGMRALWNPAIFGGVPIYCFIGPTSFNVDVLIAKMDKVIDWRLGWLILGAVGCFWLFTQLGLPWYLAVTGVIAFLFYPHFQALLNVGHFAKFRAVMAMPLLISAFIYLVKQAGWFRMLLFALAFALILRTQHYQIIFYALLLILALGIGFIIDWIKQKDWARLGRTLLIFFVATILAVLMSARPLFVANEYTPYSTRGGQEIKLNQEQTTATQSGGVSFEYATRWSLNPRELITLIIPRFYGGTSEEVYNGRAYPQLKGRLVPGYWGDMPFTQSSEYMGIVVVILAIAGFWFYRRERIVQCLAGLFVFALLLSFGSHFPVLYKALFYYLPYFSKFRVPSMILILIDFILVILAVYGLKGLIEKKANGWRLSLFVAGFFVAIGLFFLLAPGVLSFTSAQDAQYQNNQQVMEMLRTIRSEFMRADTLRMLLLAAIFVGLVVLYYFEKIGRELVVVGIFVLVSFDLIGVSKRFLRPDEFVDTKMIERHYFTETRFDKIMSQDREKFRVLGLGNQFQSNDLAYRYEIVTGYSPIKPQLIQDIIDNNLFNPGNGRQINWKVINMLNARYLIVPGMLQEPNLTVLDIDTVRRQVLFLNEDALARAFFVKRVKILPNEREVVRYLNAPDFDPSQMALLSYAFPDSEYQFDVAGSVQISEYTPNKVVLEAETEGKAFLVLGDAYYPKGWVAYVDRQEVPIYQVNHVLRGIVVPAGSHKIEFEFKPRSYRIANTIANISSGLVWLVLIVMLAGRVRPACPIARFIGKQKGKSIKGK